MSGGIGVQPVAPGDRVSDVLARDEALVEVFVRQSPHFTKLRNRTMRRIMARLVTVEDAARIAGTDAAALVGELNAALGIAAEPGAAIDGDAGEARTVGSGPPAASGAPGRPTDSRVVEVDVREDLRAGREPFSKILAAVRDVGAGDVLWLRATFEPVPLYTVLAKRGFLHEAQAEGPEDWSVWFWLPDTAGGDPAAAAPPAVEPAVEGPVPEAPPEPGGATIRLDVRGLEPPEPMVRTLTALETLPEGHTLVQLNARVPQFLLPILAERGFAWEVDDSPADHVVVRIRRRT